MRRILLLAAVLAASLGSPAQAQDTTPPRATMSIVGTGSVELRPDFAFLLVEVMTQADTVAQASDQNRVAAERLLARLRGLGVRTEDIRTTQLQVHESYPRVDSQGRQTPVPKFTARHNLSIKTRELESVGKLAGEILNGEHVMFRSLSWAVDRQDEARDEARRRAVRDARRQADVYAGAAEVRLGRLLELREPNFGGRPYSFDGEARAAPAPQSAAPMPVVAPESLRFNASVQMVWEIAP